MAHGAMSCTCAKTTGPELWGSRTGGHQAFRSGLAPSSEAAPTSTCSTPTRCQVAAASCAPPASSGSENSPIRNDPTRVATDSPSSLRLPVWNTTFGSMRTFSRVTNRSTAEGIDGNILMVNAGSCTWNPRFRSCRQEMGAAHRAVPTSACNRQGRWSVAPATSGCTVPAGASGLPAALAEHAAFVADRNALRDTKDRVGTPVGH